MRLAALLDAGGIPEADAGAGLLAPEGTIMLMRLAAPSGMPATFGNPGRLRRFTSASPDDGPAAPLSPTTWFRFAPPLAAVSQPLTLAANWRGKSHGECRRSGHHELPTPA